MKKTSQYFRIIFSLFLLNIFCLSAKAQKDSTFSRWSFGLHGSVDFDNYHYNTNDGSGLIEGNLYFDKVIDYSYGNVLLFHFSKKIFLKSGINLSEKDFKRTFILPANWQLLELPAKVINYRTLYTEFPLQLGYSFTLSKKLFLQTSDGFIFSFLTMNSEIIHYADNSLGYDSSPQTPPSYTMEYIYGSLELNWAISQKIKLVLGTNAKYNFSGYTIWFVNKNLPSCGVFFEIYADL